MDFREQNVKQKIIFLVLFINSAAAAGIAAALLFGKEIFRLPLAGFIFVLSTFLLILSIHKKLEKSADAANDPERLEELYEESAAEKEEETEHLPEIPDYSPLFTILEKKKQIIPVLINQLKAVIEQTDDAAMNLSSSFMGINTRAKEQVEQVASLFGDLSPNRNTAEDNVLIMMKDVTSELLSNFIQISDLIVRNQDATAKIIDEASIIREIVKKTDNIAENSKVLAINAAIEAARAGSHGEGFAVVAREFRKLSENSESANREISSIIDKVGQETQSLFQETESGVTQCKNLTDTAEKQLNQTIEKINSTLENAKNKLIELNSHAEQLTKEISNIVVSIQFQDITRQRIEHVIEPLQEFTQEIEECIRKIQEDRSVADQEDRKSMEWLAGKYTMEDEKRILHHTLEKEFQHG